MGEKRILGVVFMICKFCSRRCDAGIEGLEVFVVYFKMNCGLRPLLAGSKPSGHDRWGQGVEPEDGRGHSVGLQEQGDPTPTAPGQ